MTTQKQDRQQVSASVIHGNRNGRTTDFKAHFAATHIEVEFHLFSLARGACQSVGLAAPCIVTTLVQDRAVWDVCLAGVRVHILDLYQSWLRHPTLSFPAHCDGVLNCFRQVRVCKQISVSLVIRRLNWIRHTAPSKTKR